MSEQPKQPERLSEAEIDHFCTDDVVCPHCGDSWVPDTDTHHQSKEQCDECGKWYTYEAEYSVTYCTTKSEAPHD